MPEVAVLNIRGTDVPVNVNSDGQFWATIAGERLTADTFDALRQELMTQSKKATAKVAIPFTVLRQNGDELKDGVATGVHGSRRGVVLVRWADGKAGDLGYDGGYGQSVILNPLTGPERNELLALNAAVTEARDALSAFIAGHRKVSIRAEVEAEVAKAVAGA